MAVFIDYQNKFVVITLYKVGYSTLKGQQSQSFKYLFHEVNWNVYKHLIKHYHFKYYCMVRHPYERFASLFTDKYRKHPVIIPQGLHTWENVHKCLYPHLQITAKDTDEAIASKFLKMQPSDFLKILPLVIQEDLHFSPQTYSYSFKFFNRIPIKLRIDGFFRMEDQLEELGDLTGLNFGITANPSNSKKTETLLTTEDKRILYNIYKRDFVLGGYNKDDSR